MIVLGLVVLVVVAILLINRFDVASSLMSAKLTKTKTMGSTSAARNTWCAGGDDGSRAIRSTKRGI